MEIKRVLVNIFILLSLALVFQSVTADDDECVYTIYIRTGLIIKAGTDSNITLELWSDKGNGVSITNIEEWGGLMGRDYDYFERGNLDIFSGRGPCLSGPVCAMKLTSDGSGPHPGWYCSYVEVTTTGPHMQCAQERFDVQQWLADDVYPYTLTAVKNHCDSNDDDLTVKSRPTKVLSSLKKSIFSS